MIKKIILSLFLVLAPLFISGQELPPIQNYSPNDYQGENQNWDISQDDDALIYAANNIGLLEFNGAHWQVYPSPNNTILRSVEVIDSKIYTGAYMEFGYWTRNIFGTLYYTSISSIINDQLLEEDFWNIIGIDEYILFQSLSRIYIYNTEEKSFEIIDTETRLPKMFKFDDQIYFQKINQGIFKIENGKVTLVADGPVAKQNIIANLFRSRGAFIVQTQDVGAYIFQDDKIEYWDVPANEFLAKNSIYSSIQLHDNSLIFGTISDGIFHVSEDGEILFHVNQKNGLNNNTALSLFQDMDHNIWVGLDNGISVINLDSPFIEFNDIYGDLGSVYASETFKNNLYLGTNQGLFYREKDSNDPFKFIDGTKGQVWCLEIIDNTLFCGHNNGTFIVDDVKATQISNEMGAWKIKTIPGIPNLLIQGNYDGLTLLKKENNSWTFRNKVENFEISSRSFDFISQNELIVNHENKGALKLQLSDDFTKVNRYETIKSAPISLKSHITKFGNQLYYFAENGLYRFNSSQNEFELDPISSQMITEDDSYESGKLIADNKTKQLWAFSNKNILLLTPGKMNDNLEVEKIAMPATKRNFTSGYENISKVSPNKHMFGTTGGYFILNDANVTSKDFQINLNKIENNILNREPVLIETNQERQFKSSQNNFTFYYSVPSYSNFNEVSYQYQLKGLSNVWSDWNTKASVNFENLRHGDYTFNVRAKRDNKLSTNIYSYTFKIERPWFISNEFVALYFILLLILFFIIHISNKRYYKKQKIKQLEKQEKEFTLSQLENEQQIMKLRNDKLRHEVASKSRELSSSTMNIVKKNELLNEIKGELEEAPKNEKVNAVLKIIDKNLSEGSDWKMFEKAFNDADSDFLKKIKSLHPNLTPSDLKLCAYLRLNLSSKEIAPLLHISSRSVEIKRYRLRKKMNLEHEKSLVEYILQV